MAWTGFFGDRSRPFSATDQATKNAFSIWGRPDGSALADVFSVGKGEPPQKERTLSDDGHLLPWVRSLLLDHPGGEGASGGDSPVDSAAEAGSDSGPIAPIPPSEEALPDESPFEIPEEREIASGAMVLSLEDEPLSPYGEVDLPEMSDVRTFSEEKAAAVRSFEKLSAGEPAAERETGALEALSVPSGLEEELTLEAAALSEEEKEKSLPSKGLTAEESLPFDREESAPLPLFQEGFDEERPPEEGAAVSTGGTDVSWDEAEEVGLSPVLSEDLSSGGPERDEARSLLAEEAGDDSVADRRVAAFSESPDASVRPLAAFPGAFVEADQGQPQGQREEGIPLPAGGTDVPFAEISPEGTEMPLSPRMEPQPFSSPVGDVSVGEGHAEFLLPTSAKAEAGRRRSWAVRGGTVLVAASLVAGGYAFSQKVILPRLWEKNVREALEKEDLPSLRQLLPHLEEKGPLSPTLKEAYGRLLLEKGNAEEAFDVFRELHDVAGPDGKILLLMGQAASRGGRVEEAEPLFREALTVEPSSWQAYAELGSLCAASGRGSEAIDLCREALKRAPERPELKGLLGIALVEGERWDEALPLLREALEGDPDNARLRTALSAAQAGAEKERLETLRLEELRRDEEEADRFRKAGRDALAAERFEEALALFRRAGVFWEGRDEVCLRGEAFALLGLNRFAEARPLFERLLEGAPDDQDLLRGMEELRKREAEEVFRLRKEDLRRQMAAARRGGDEKSLLAAAKELMVLDPADSMAPMELGRISLARGRLDEAERLFRGALDQDEHNGEARAGLGRVSEQRRALRLARARSLGLQGVSLSESGGEPGRALSLLKEAFSLDPNLEEVLFPLARVLERQGDLRGAERYYRELLLRAPSQGRAWNNLALIRYRQGKGDEAEELLSRGLDSAPMNRTLARNLALLRLVEGREEEALDPFRHYFKLDPFEDGGDEREEERLALEPMDRGASQRYLDGYMTAFDGTPLALGLPLEERLAFLEPFAAAVEENPVEADAYFGYLLSLGVGYPLAENPAPWQIGLSLVGAHSHLARGRFSDASRLLEAIPPSERERDPAVSMLLGHALRHLQRYSEARESYRYAFLQTPGDPVVRESLRRLLEAYANRKTIDKGGD